MFTNSLFSHYFHFILNTRMYQRQYAARNLAILNSTLNDLSLLSKACFTVGTKFSANPFEDGWYGGTHLWTISFASTKDSNWTEVKGGPLPETNVTGTPCIANIVLNLSIIWNAEVELTKWSSGQSTKMSNRCFPHWAWSIWSHFQIWCRIIHAWAGTGKGLAELRQYLWQLWQISSKSASRYGQQR